MVTLRKKVWVGSAKRKALQTGSGFVSAVVRLLSLALWSEKVAALLSKGSSIKHLGQF